MEDKLLLVESPVSKKTKKVNVSLSPKPLPSFSFWEDQSVNPETSTRAVYVNISGINFQNASRPWMASISGDKLGFLSLNHHEIVFPTQWSTLVCVQDSLNGVVYDITTNDHGISQNQLAMILKSFEAMRKM